MLMGNASKILQTVSANIDRDVIEGSMMQLQDLLLLTDTSGLLTGEERLTVQGVNVAIQRETLRQRQIEFLTATNNPTDMKIMGVKGRSVVLRSVSTTIGMPGEDIVPSEDQIDKMMAEEKKKSQGGGNIDEMIQQAVNKGVEAGVKRISTELTSGVLATHAHMPEGKPTHIGTPGSFDGQGQSTSSGGGVDMNQPQGSQAQDAAHAQGNKPSPLSQSMGPQTHLMGHGQPQPGGKVTGGPE